MNDKDLDLWILWLKQRIPELKTNGSYCFWIKQAIKGAIEESKATDINIAENKNS